MSSEQAERRSDRRVEHAIIAGIVIILASVAILGFILTPRALKGGPQGVQAAPTQCGSGLTGDITQDTTWSGDIYVDGSIKVESSATLTMTPGTQVLFCGAYDLQIGGLFSPGRLVAEGTADQSITFGAATDQNWGQLYFGDPLDGGPSILQHVILEDGGGSDPTQGETIMVSDRAPLTYTASPRIYGVTVRRSNGYGITVNAAGNDPKPTQLTDVTVEGSSLHPVNVDVNAVSGIGTGLEVTGNSPDRIRVFGNRMNFDSRWRDHGVPYEVTNGFAMRSNYPDEDVVPAVWTIDPGVTILMHPDVEVTVGSLYGEGQVMAKGTPDAPISITRLDDQSAPWAGFTFSGHNDVDSEFEHADLLYGGSTTDNRRAVINKRGTGQVRLQNVSIRHSLNGAIWVFGGDVWVKDSTITNNDYGIDVQARTRATVRGSDLTSNAEFALRNGSPNKVCLDATGNFWGPGGPSDTSAAEDACGSTRTNDGTATVSDGIAYTPWETADGGFGTIQPRTFWVIADGLSTTEIRVRLVDGQGQPLSGKQVELETTLGTLQQPTSPTDENGETTGVISSTETGFATVTAFNATDDKPVPGTAGINFWQGSADFGGLADPTGAPYASPALELDGKPFQAGFPVEMRMPIRNTRPSRVDVEVVYGVTGLSIGTHFTPVYSDTKTLETGETWDARGVWVPESAGHHCIQGTLSYSDRQGHPQVLDSGSGARQVNTNENPCSGLPSNPNDYHPGEPEGGSEDIKTIAEHFKEMVKYSRDATECIDQEVRTQSLGKTDQSDRRDYEVIVSVPTFTPPTVTTAHGVTQAQADALNALNETGAQLLGLSRAIGATRQRMEWAAQANELGDLDRQYSAFLDFVERYAQAWHTLADQHDDLLATTEGAGVADAYYQPEDFEEAFNDLVENGFDPDTVDFLEESGLSQDLIEEIRQDIIDTTEGNTFEVTSFYQTVRDTRDEARRIARKLEQRYGLGTEASSQAQDPLIRTEPQVFDFTVSHQSDQEETVNLEVRSVSLPMDWSARLDRETVTLGVGESVSNTLTLVPGESIPEASTVKVGVEGYVTGELIGGILFTYNAPVVTEQRTGGQIFLPLTLKDF